MTLFTFLEQRLGELLAATLRHTCSSLNAFSVTEYSNMISEESASVLWSPFWFDTLLEATNGSFRLSITNNSGVVPSSEARFINASSISGARWTLMYGHAFV